MIYAIRHRTTYSYESHVDYARCVMRLTPENSSTQTLVRSAISVSPFPAQTSWRIGSFGERVMTVVIDEPHKALVIEATSTIEVQTARPQLPFDSPAWEMVRADALVVRDLGAAGPASYLYPTTRTPIVPDISDYARASFAPSQSIIAAVTDLTERLHRDFTYDRKATNVATPVTDSFRTRRGVCQDFAHIMIAGLRGLGLPAAYVSGYLRTVPPAGRPRLQGADATHAWVSVWCGSDYGWIGFDPTNACRAQDDHIVLATGRDYGDVAPIEGIILAPGRQLLKVAVDVVPQDAR
jgi:transglutaminase-like putative cysteine protease